MSSFVRIPPDSSGKRIQHSTTILVEYAQGISEFNVGDKVVAQSSQVQGEIGRILNGSTTEEGSFYLVLGLDSNEILQTGEILLVDNNPYAEVAQYQNIYTQNTQIAGATNTSYKANVDRRGAIYTRTAEGSHQFDAFGKLEISQSTTIGEYSFEYNKLDEDIYYKEESGGAVTHDPDSASIVLSCGTGDQSLVQATTHLYHTYQASIAHHIALSVSIGDDGKNNVTRRWGYFDDEDGAFFELKDQTLNVVIRSSATGTVQEIRVPQSDWNVDRLDGSEGSFNLSDIDLDITNLYLWWLDFHWYGAGIIRFGIRINGERITCHKTSAHDRGSLPFMKRASLPLRVEQFNSGTPISISEMRLVESSVNAMGIFKPRYKTFAVDGTLPPKTINDNDFQVLFSGRVKELFQGLENRSVALPFKLTSFVDGDNAVELKIVKNSTLTGDTWTIDAGPESTVEIDATATDSTGGRLVWKDLVSPNCVERLDLSPIFNFEQGDTVKRHANISGYDTFTLFGRLVKVGGPTVDISLSMIWKEIK